MAAERIGTPGGVLVVDSQSFSTYHSFARSLPGANDAPVAAEWQLEKYTCIVGLQALPASPMRQSASLQARKRRNGRVPEWLKGTGCKPVGSAYLGSNPSAPTILPV